MPLNLINKLKDTFQRHPTAQKTTTNSGAGTFASHLKTLFTL